MNKENMRKESCDLVITKTKDIVFQLFLDDAWVVFHYPQFSYTAGMSLICGVSQSAILLKDGNVILKVEAERVAVPHQLLSLFEQHVFKTKNFQLDIYYFHMKMFHNIKWGTKINGFDHLLQCYGHCVIRIADEEKFLKRVIGSSLNYGELYSESSLKSFLLPHIISIIQQIHKESFNYELTIFKQRLHAALLQSFQQYGLELCDCLIESYKLIQLDGSHE